MAYAFIQGGGDGHVEVRKEDGKREVGVLKSQVLLSRFLPQKRRQPRWHTGQYWEGEGLPE